MDDTGTTVAQRQRCARAVAGTDRGTLAALLDAWQPAPTVEQLRGPEAGLVMVRGRIGGGGYRFNLGEATVCRATVRVAAETGDWVIGTGYVLGSDKEHARLAAVFDALLVDPGRRERVLREVVEPLEAALAVRDARDRAEARSTLVDFFTVAREHE